MVSDQPLVSIGVPIFNDKPFLCNALAHMLDQEYNNLEIILADDGSTDGSREICREYAKRDARIRLFENSHNLGAVGNHKFVFDVSTGDYFAWGSGHDYFHPAFVAHLLENLRTNPSVVMCCSQSVFVRENGDVLRTSKGGLDTRGLPPVVRLELLLTHLTSGGTANIFYGLYRQDALAQANLARKVDGCDVILLGELSLLGDMYQINDVLYYRLVTYQENEKKRTARHAMMLDGVRGFNVNTLMPYFSAGCEFLSIAESNQLSPDERGHACDTVFEFDFNIGRRAKVNEIEQFIPLAKKELVSLMTTPQVRQYRAALILDSLERAFMLGFGFDGLYELRSTCLSAMGLQAEASAAVRDATRLYKVETVKRLSSHLPSKVAKKLNKMLIGVKAIIFQRHFSTLFYLLSLIWVFVVLILYLLLFSPPLYWSVISRFGIANMLDVWRIYIIEFFELNKGFH